MPRQHNEPVLQGFTTNPPINQLFKPIWQNLFSLQFGLWEDGKKGKERKEQDLLQANLQQNLFCQIGTKSCFIAGSVVLFFNTSYFVISLMM